MKVEPIFVTAEVAITICVTLVFLLVLSVAIIVLLHKLIDLLRPATGFTIHQGRKRMAIKGIPVGGSGSFSATPNGALQAGAVPAWSADDSNVSIVPAADSLSAAVSVAAGDAGAAFNLSVSGVNSAGVSFSSSVSVPILPAVPVPATAFDIEQTA